MLLPIVLTVYVMWWFLEFFDGFFSPLYDALFGFHVFGLGFLTTMIFVFGVGGERASAAGRAVLACTFGTCQYRFAFAARDHAAASPPAAAAVFTSTWVGSVTMGMGEYIIKRVPLVKHIYSAAKQARWGLAGWLVG